MKSKMLYLLLATLAIMGGCTKKQGLVDDPAIIVGGQDSEIIERSEIISDIVVELYGIDDATTIIFNDTALIGVKIAYDNKLTSDIRDSIINIVKEKDAFISEVKVTQKENIFAQIDNIMNELLKGKSYDNFVNEISKVQNKIK